MYESTGSVIAMYHKHIYSFPMRSGHSSKLMITSPLGAPASPSYPHKPIVLVKKSQCSCSVTNLIKAQERPESSKMCSLLIWNQTCASRKTKRTSDGDGLILWRRLFLPLLLKWIAMAALPLRHKTLFSVSGIPPTQLISSKIRFLGTEIYHLIHSAFGCSVEFSNQMINDAGLDSSSHLNVSLARYQIPTNVPDSFASNLESLH